MMKAFVFGAALLALTGSIASADQPGPDWLSMDAVIKILHDKGYTDIREIEADDGHWEADAAKGGRIYEIHVDPKSGQLTKAEPKK